MIRVHIFVASPVPARHRGISPWASTLRDETLLLGAGDDLRGVRGVLGLLGLLGIRVLLVALEWRHVVVRLVVLLVASGKAAAAAELGEVDAAKVAAWKKNGG